MDNKDGAWHAVYRISENARMEVLEFMLKTSRALDLQMVHAESLAPVDSW
jgi:hypothetical protein